MLVAINQYAGTMLLPIFVLVAIAGRRTGPDLRRHGRGEGPPPLAQDLLVGALLLVVAFWATERAARAVGDALTHEWQRRLATQPPLALFSEGQLHIASPGVTETLLGGDDSRYAYRYDGLYLLQRSGDKYFLVTNAWQDGEWAGRLVVLPDDDTIRLEFTSRCNGIGRSHACACARLFARRSVGFRDQNKPVRTGFLWPGWSALRGPLGEENGMDLGDTIVAAFNEVVNELVTALPAIIGALIILLSATSWPGS